MPSEGGRADLCQWQKQGTNLSREGAHPVAEISPTKRGIRGLASGGGHRAKLVYVFTWDTFLYELDSKNITSYSVIDQK